jgi:hypothetical protein
MDILEDFNSNLYVKLCHFLNGELESLNAFILKIRKEKEYAELLNLEHVYKEIFTDPIFNGSVEIIIDRVLNPHYNLFSTIAAKSGNSTFFVSIKITSDSLLEIDLFYNKQLSSLIRLFKNLFTVVDKPSYNITEEDLLKYESLIEDVTKKMNHFLSFVDNKQMIEKRKKITANMIRNLPHSGFYHMTHYDNLDSVLNHGLISHNQAVLNNLIKVDISNPLIQKNRNRNEAVFGRNIQDYVPLYINPQNPMMVSEKVKSYSSSIILLEVIPHILVQMEETLFSDGNAAQLQTNFFHNQDEMENVNWQLLQEGKWVRGTDSHRVMCSEVLIPDKIEVFYLNKIILKDNILLKKVMELFPNHKGINIEINSNYFSTE